MQEGHGGEQQGELAVLLEVAERFPRESPSGLLVRRRQATFAAPLGRRLIPASPRRIADHHVDLGALAFVEEVRLAQPHSPEFRQQFAGGHQLADVRWIDLFQEGDVEREDRHAHGVGVDVQAGELVDERFQSAPLNLLRGLAVPPLLAEPLEDADEEDAGAAGRVEEGAVRLDALGEEPRLVPKLRDHAGGKVLGGMELALGRSIRGAEELVVDGADELDRDELEVVRPQQARLVRVLPHLHHAAVEIRQSRQVLAH